MFTKVLVANRGEIAVRIVRALDELGVASVAVCSELDREALHPRRAGEAYNLGPGPAAENYLNVEKILDVARRSHAEAIHPGYGFLAENAAFAAACEREGITFIGPPASAIEGMGSKTRARQLMSAAGVPIVPGTTEPVWGGEQALEIVVRESGRPGAVEDAGGGGGVGCRLRGRRHRPGAARACGRGRAGLGGRAGRGRVLLPGDEHPRPGRALRDRDEHGRRHRQGGDPRGGGRAARLQPAAGA